MIDLSAWMLSSSILILLVLALRSLLRRRISGRVQYALWALVLARLLLPLQLFSTPVSVEAVTPDLTPLLESVEFYGGRREVMDLPEEVKTTARGVYDAIARAEAKAHGCPVGEVHYHEVGALDAVADVVGACYALWLLSPDRIVASPVHVGSGTVRCAHGVMPVPAPATANLLTGVPAYGGEVQGELCTPTGAALLVTFAQSFGPMPALAADRVGCGVGRKVFDRPNCVRAFLGESGGGANGATASWCATSTT